MKTKILFITIVLLMSFSINAQNKNETTKPKIGLVLSGGGARGSAHIGVLKVLEEYNIRPDYITGTSMGSIVAALYSQGYTASQIEKIVTNMDWDNLLADKIPLKDIMIIEKDNYPGYPLEINFDNQNKPSLPSGMIDGQKIQALFSKLTWKSNTYNNYDSFPIPYRCLATDIISGYPYIFKQGSLAEAMRSSMSIPTVFVPINKDTMLLVDGGVTINYPVQQCIDMGADIIIGSYTGFDERPDKSSLRSLTSILSRSSVISGVVDAKKQEKNTDLFIKPDLHDFTPADFNKSKKIIKQGELAARNSEVLKKLSEIAALVNNTDSLPLFIDTNKIWVDNIIVEGSNLTDSSRVLRLSKLKNNSYMLPEQIDEALKDIYSTWQYNKVSYYFTKNGDKTNLVLKLDERSRGIIRLGLHYDNSYGPNILFRGTYENLFFRQTLLDTKISISESPRAYLGYKFYPIKAGRIELSVNGYFQMTKVPNFIKQAGGIFNIGHFVFLHSDFYGKIAIAPFRNLVLSAQIGGEYNSVFLKDGMDLYYNVNRLYLNQLYSKFKIKLNTLDDNFFPTKGILLKASLKYTNNVTKGTVLKTDTNKMNSDSTGLIDGVEDYNILLDFKYKQYILIRKHFSIIPELEVATRINSAFITEKYFIGGMNYSLHAKSYNFPGIKENHFSADYFSIIGIELQLKFLKTWYVFSGTHQLVFGNYNDYNYIDAEFEDNIITSWNIGLGLQTKIGPIRLIYSKQYDNKENIWSLNIGIPF